MPAKEVGIVKRRRRPASNRRISVCPHCGSGWLTPVDAASSDVECVFCGRIWERGVFRKRGGRR